MQLITSILRKKEVLIMYNGITLTDTKMQEEITILFRKDIEQLVKPIDNEKIKDTEELYFRFGSFRKNFYFIVEAIILVLLRDKDAIKNGIDDVYKLYEDNALSFEGYENILKFISEIEEKNIEVDVLSKQQLVSKLVEESFNGLTPYGKIIKIRLEDIVHKNIETFYNLEKNVICYYVRKQEKNNDRYKIEEVKEELENQFFQYVKKQNHIEIDWEIALDHYYNEFKILFNR